MRKAFSILGLVVALALVLAACGEMAQEAGKVYAGKEDTKPYAGDQFKGDKKKWEQTLATRAGNMNEYLRVEEAKK